MTEFLIMVPACYVLGSIPFGLMAGLVSGRIDVRDHGSGSIGMTNVLRTVGRPAAAVVLLLDMGKGVLAVVLAKIFFDSDALAAVAGVAVLVGHNWPVFIGFRGGKGTASGWGSLLLLSPISGLVATVVGLLTVGTTRYVSLGSMLAVSLGCGTLIILSAIGEAPAGYVWFAVIGGAVVLFRHRENMQRLLRGEERKLGQAREPSEVTA